MKSFLKKTIFNYYINKKMSQSNFFLKFKNIEENKNSLVQVEQMVVNSCLTGLKSHLNTKNFKAPLYLKTFNVLEKFVDEKKLENEIVLFFYNNLFFTSNFNKLKFYLSSKNLFLSFINLCSNLFLFRFIKRKTLNIVIK